MSYVALARKYRPRDFAGLVGQEHVVKPLQKALSEQRLHHAYLFSGTRGVGKTTVARILAKALNCEQGVSAEPCGRCDVCLDIDQGRFLDLMEIDAASRTKVDDTRALLENVPYAPSRGRFKIYLIDEVHMLSTHSFNALLKTLEEPPDYVKFLLATTDPQKLPVTVLSRCLQFSLARIGTPEIEAQLARILEAEELEAAEGSLRELARAADGSMRDALSLLDHALGFADGKLEAADVRAMLGTVDGQLLEQLLGALSDTDQKKYWELVEQVSSSAANLSRVMDQLAARVHELAVGELLDQRRDPFTFTDQDLQVFYEILTHAIDDLRLAPDERVGWEMCALRLWGFRPADRDAEREPDRSGSRPENPSVAAPRAAAGFEDTPARAVPTNLDAYAALIGELALTPSAKSLAGYSRLGQEGDDLIVRVHPKAEAFRTTRSEKVLLDALRQCWPGRTIKLMDGDPELQTPAGVQELQKRSEAEAGERKIADDPAVRDLQERFGARILPDTYEPKADGK